MVKYVRIQALPFNEEEKKDASLLKKYYDSIREKGFIILGYTYMFDKSLKEYSSREIEKICSKEGLSLPSMIECFRNIDDEDIIYVYFPSSYPFPPEISGKSLIGIVSKGYDFEEKSDIYDEWKEKAFQHIVRVNWKGIFDIGEFGQSRMSCTKLHQGIDKINEVLGMTSDHTENNIKLNKNTILYGPPGTGKTFKTKEKAVNIIFEIKAPIGDIPNDFKFIDEPGEMNYELVDNLDEIKGNITTFNQELENKDQKIISKLTQFTHWYYLESIDKFGPSKFIGYKSMTSEIYDKLYNNGLDGRDTEKKFKQISLPYKEASGDIKQKLIKLLRDYGHELKNNAVVNIIVE